MKFINIFKLKTDFYELNFPEFTPWKHVKMVMIKFIFFQHHFLFLSHVHGIYLQVLKWEDATLGDLMVFLEF